MWCQQRSHVPKFGNWESEENVPYTAYFDKARKGRTSGGKMINPNDPQENSETFSENSSPPRAPPTKTRVDPDEPVGRFSDPPARKASTESTHQRYGGGRGPASAEMHKRQGKPSGGSEHSVERSPLHPQARSSEGKVSSEGSHGTPGRSRMKPVTRADDSVNFLPQCLSSKYNLEHELSNNRYLKIPFGSRQVLLYKTCGTSYRGSSEGDHNMSFLLEIDWKYTIFLLNLVEFFGISLEVVYAPVFHTH